MKACSCMLAPKAKYHSKSVDFPARRMPWRRYRSRETDQQLVTRRKIRRRSRNIDRSTTLREAVASAPSSIAALPRRGSPRKPRAVTSLRRSPRRAGIPRRLAGVAHAGGPWGLDSQRPGPTGPAPGSLSVLLALCQSIGQRGILPIVARWVVALELGPGRNICVDF